MCPDPERTLAGYLIRLCEDMLLFSPHLSKAPSDWFKKELNGQ